MTTIFLSGPLSSNVITLTDLAGGGFAWQINLTAGASGADDVTVAGGVDDDIIDLSGLSAASGVLATSIFGGNGGVDDNDSIIGSAIADRIDGGQGEDTIRGGIGSDTITGGGESDQLFGDSGNDVFLTTATWGQGDIFNGGTGTDTLRNIQGQSTTFTNIGAANLISIEVLDGVDGATFFGDGGNNTLNFSTIGSAINVGSINAGAGNDTISGVRNTAVVINGEAGDDVINGNRRGELLNGGADADTIIGNAGNDSIDGGAGADSLLGGTGNDVFLMGGLQGFGDIFNGGSGTDTIRHTNLGQTIRLLNVTDANFISVERFDGTGQSLGGDETGNLIDMSAIATAIGVSSIEGAGGNDTLVAFGITAVTINGGNGNDSITGNDRAEALNGGGDADTIAGGVGTDTIDGGVGLDDLSGGIGNDVFLRNGVEGAGDIYRGDQGVDTIRQTNLGQSLTVLSEGDANFIGIEVFDFVGSSVQGDAGDNLIDFSAIATAIALPSISGLGGNDTISAFRDTATLINGGSGNDNITGNGVAETLNGDADNDTISGFAGNDTINGGDGADSILGGAGADSLVGGAGNDAFVYRSVTDSLIATRDIIAGFDAAGAVIGDIINLRGVDADNALAGDQNFTFNSTATGGLSLITSGTDTLVQLNTDADAAFEFVLVIVDGATLSTDYTAADFVL